MDRSRTIALVATAVVAAVVAAVLLVDGDGDSRGGDDRRQLTRTEFLGQVRDRIPSLVDVDDGVIVDFGKVVCRADENGQFFTGTSSDSPMFGLSEKETSYIYQRAALAFCPDRQ